MADEFQLLNIRGLTLRDDFNYFSYNSTRENFFPWTNLNDLIFLKQIKQILHFLLNVATTVSLFLIYQLVQ